MYREIGDLFNFYGQRIGSVGMMKTELYTMFKVELYLIAPLSFTR